jgi:hypothetical protein
MRKKSKLTVTIDGELIPRAKRHARSLGVSLSSLIEDALREMSSDAQAPFSERWAGTFVPAGRDDDRYRRLAKKYL